MRFEKMVVAFLVWSSQADAYDFLRTSCFSTEPRFWHWGSKLVRPVCASVGSPSASGRTYSDPRAGSFGPMFRSANDYAWDFTKGHAVYFDVDSVTCFAPDEAPGISLTTPLAHPSYNGANSSLTFGLPSTDTDPSGNLLLGRAVSSISPLGTTASFTCYPLEKADHSRFDLLLVPGLRQVFPRDTFTDQDVLSATNLHEWGHVMGLRHDNSFPSLMNASPTLANAALYGRRLVAGPGSQARVVVKGDGDMSQGLFALGYIPRRGNQPDYGLTPVARIVSTNSDGTIADVTHRTREVDLMIPSSGPFALPNVSLTFFNHSRYVGGSIVFVAVPEFSNFDIALEPPPGPWFDLNTFPLPLFADITAWQTGGGVYASDRVGNVFFDLNVPVPPAALAAMRAGMVKGRRYRVVMVTSPGPGYVDGDDADNFISTGITLRLQ